MNLNDSMNKILEHTPISYIICEIIKDLSGNILDYKILDYNASYLNLISRNLSKPDLKAHNFILNIGDDIPQLLSAISNNQDFHVLVYSSIYEKWLDILLIYESENKFIMQIKDMTKEKILEEKLEAKKQELNLFRDIIDDLIVVSDLNGKIIYANNSWEKSLGYSPHEVIGSEVKDFLDPASYEMALIAFKNRFSLDRGHIIRTQMLKKDGNYAIMEWNSSAHKDVVCAVGRDITALIESQEQVLYLCYHDKLTGLYNRSFFEEELKRLDNDRNLPLSIIMGDINGLKITNDAFGHLKGDKLLKNIANILSNSLRKGDILSRWGGDEFTILLPSTDEKTTLDIIDRIKAACKEKSTLLNHSTISLGCDIKLFSEKDVYEVLTNAENNMYKNKAKDGKKFRENIISSMKKYLRDERFENNLSSRKTKSYLKKIGNHLNLSQDDLDNLILLADIHDIGLISVPKSILNKKTALNESEWEQIRNHTESGYRIAKSIPETAHIANYILHHHERYDGKGYPDGLKADEIPYLNRIFAVVDVYESLSQNKAYRNSFAQVDIINCLKTNSGRLFDPKIVDLFLNILEEEEDQRSYFAN